MALLPPSFPPRLSAEDFCLECMNTGKDWHLQF
ncbi:hypothetical protein R38712_01999 [Ralstonia pickettii]|jgi:hypothetical protein|uniref:Uncharacterized protein n=2 Tax=Ralstonia pickettii TaxID=329 RepID=A0ABN9I1W6_RALPI|nr:hypothetical protein R38712_01999 [Ralstonia pickettii]